MIREAPRLSSFSLPRPPNPPPPRRAHQHSRKTNFLSLSPSSCSSIPLLVILYEQKSACGGRGPEVILEVKEPRVICGKLFLTMFVLLLFTCLSSGCASTENPFQVVQPIPGGQRVPYTSIRPATTCRGGTKCTRMCSSTTASLRRIHGKNYLPVLCRPGTVAITTGNGTATSKGDPPCRNRSSVLCRCGVRGVLWFHAIGCQ